MPVFFTGGPGIQFQEQVRGVGISPVEHCDEDAITVTRILDVDWNERYAAYRTLLGYSKVQTTAAGNKFVSRQTPEPYYDLLDDQGNPYLYAVKVEGSGIKPNTTSPPLDGKAVTVYKKARLKVTYATLPYDIISDAGIIGQGYTRNNDANCLDEASCLRYVTKQGSPAAQYVTIRGGVFKYVMGGTPVVTQGLGKMLVNVNWLLTWHSVPQDGVPCGFVNNNVAAGAGAIETCLGRVNNAAFPPGQNLTGFQKATLLLMSAQIKPVRNLFGKRCYDITYGFKFFSPATNATHQHVYRPESTAWLEVSTDGTTNLGTQTAGKSPYDYADFATLLRPQ